MKALLVVDVQNDFCPGGALAVPEGDQVVPFTNAIRGDYTVVVFSQDWHPPGHKSFANSNPGTQVGQVIELHGQPQVMWPDHCVQDTPGAAFHKDLLRRPDDRVFRKGELIEVDSYSAFMDNDHHHETGLNDYLKAQGVTSLDVVGLATDYCVRYSVLDARKFGYEVVVLRSGCRAVNLEPGDGEKALAEMEAAGAILR